MPEYRFQPIDVNKDASRCIEFRRHSYLASFGSLDGFEQEIGPNGQKYLNRLAIRASQVPEGNAHLWKDNAVIGQTEMSLPKDEAIGYVNLVVLAPQHRFYGLGEMLHTHACRVFRQLSKPRLQLSASPSNTAALAFYQKHGWRCIGPRPDKPTMLLHEFSLMA